MTDDKIRKYVIPNLPYVFIFWFCCKLGEAYRTATGTDTFHKLMGSMTTLGKTMASPLSSFNPRDLLVGITGTVIIYAVVYFKKKNAKKFRKDMEYGSARWGKPEDIKPYIDPKPENNVILTQTESLTMNPRPSNPKFARNKNVMIIGGSGSGKTRFWLKPNLMQLHSSYVITDPKGTVLIECGKLLKRGVPKTEKKLDKDGNTVKDKRGDTVYEVVRDKNEKIVYEPYVIKVLNTIDFSKSMHYNPFDYIRSEKDILKFVTALINNTKGDGKGGDDFWQKEETLLYTALIGYIHYEAPDYERNLNTLVELINAMEVREDDETFENAIDIMFKTLEERDPQHFALRQYKKYKLAAQTGDCRNMANDSF